MTTNTPSADVREPPERRPASPARKLALDLATLFLVSVVAACTTGGAASREPALASPAPTPSIAAIVTPPAASSSPLPLATSTITPVNTAADGSGDATPAYLDISRLRVEATGGLLTLVLDLAAAVPPGSPEVGQLAYVFSLDVDGDGAWDHTATLRLVPEGGFRPTLVDRRSGVRLEGAAYPGTANLAGRSVTLTVPFAALGCPPIVGVRAASEQTKGGTTTGDTVPDAETEWIQVSSGCPPSP